MKQKKRSEIKLVDTWDLTVIYQNDSDWYKDLESLKEEIKIIEAYKGRLLESSKTLLEFLELSDTLERKLYKLYYYAHLNFDVDTTNTTSRELLGLITNLLNDYSNLNSFVNPELLKTDYSLIEGYLKEEKGLDKYRYNLENLYRYQDHILSDKEELILSTLSKAINASEEIYSSLTDSDLSFGNIKVDGKTVEFTESNYSVLIKHSNRDVRKKAFNKLYKTYSSFINTIADTFRFNIESLSKIATIKKYPSSIEASLFSDNIDLSVYNNLISSVNANLATLYKYYDLKKKVLGTEKFHLYDAYVEMVSEIDRKYTFKEAKEIVLEGLKVLGDDYITKLEKAFDERYIDIYNNKGKRGGAYSSGFYDTNPYILLNFEGEYEDIKTLAHELGHSMHTVYSNEGNPYNTSRYKIFVAEVASTVNELLLLKYLIKKAANRDEKLYLLNNLLELFKGTIFRQTMFAEFEQKMHDSHEQGIILTGEYLSNEYYELVKKYFGPNVIVDDLIKYEWERIPHFYYNFYVYKYAIGLSAACKIVKDIEEQGIEAVNKYKDFLRTGGSMDPADELLVCGVDVNSPLLVKSAINFFDEAIEEFTRIQNEER